MFRSLTQRVRNALNRTRRVAPAPMAAAAAAPNASQVMPYNDEWSDVVDPELLSLRDQFPEEFATAQRSRQNEFHLSKNGITGLTDENINSIESRMRMAGLAKVKPNESQDPITLDVFQPDEIIVGIKGLHNNVQYYLKVDTFKDYLRDWSTRQPGPQGLRKDIYNKDYIYQPDGKENYSAKLYQVPSMGGRRKRRRRTARKRRR